MCAARPPNTNTALACEHITDPGEIAAHGVMRNPGLVVVGRVAGAAELAGLLA